MVFKILSGVKKVKKSSCPSYHKIFNVSRNGFLKFFLKLFSTPVKFLTKLFFKKFNVSRKEF